MRVLIPRDQNVDLCGPEFGSVVRIQRDIRNVDDIDANTKIYLRK